MLRGINYIKNSSASTHYTESLAETDVETEAFPGLRGDGQGTITAVQVRSVENRTWGVEIYDKDGYITNLVTFQAAGATPYVVDGKTWYFYSESLEWDIPLTVPYETVTVGLRNMSPEAKTAGEEGAVVVTIVFRK